MHKILLKPGTYRLNVSRRGYLPQSLTIDLGVAGREENLRVLLQPLRIDDLLDDAGDQLAKGNYETARVLAGDVLLLNASHARANLLFGMSKMRQGSEEAVDHILKAIRNGETFRTRVKIQEPESMRLIAAELGLDQFGISIKSSERFDLDFTILKNDVSELNFSPEPSPGFVFLSGKSDFHGKQISPEFKVHPHDIVADERSATTRCATRGCEKEIATMGRILLAWRAE